MAEIVLGVKEMIPSDHHLEVTNALYKYSGVLEVDINRNGTEIRVRYEPYNIRADDLKETLQSEGYRVEWVKS
ncbi:MAG: heavy-metal-associated domain-containing protein [Bacillota bacterium]